MSDADVRQILDELIRNSGEDYASVSRMLGRNPTYIQQFVKRGVPRRLNEEDRRALSTHFGVAEALLGGPTVEPAAQSIAVQAADRSETSEYLLVPALAIRASAGPAPRVQRDFAAAQLAFRSNWAKELARGSVDALSMLRVEGDSMQPTLNNGDHILLDMSDRAERIRDGLYVLRLDGALVVKRLAVNPSTRKLSIRSDNPAYPGWDSCDPELVVIVGRVVWVGRAIG